jgi:hypothetical protein
MRREAVVELRTNIQILKVIPLMPVIEPEPQERIRRDRNARFPAQGRLVALRPRVADPGGPASSRSS